jgi:hypothetical protein
VLALAAGCPDRRGELGVELSNRLSLMDASEVGWALWRDPHDLATALGADALIRLARTIPAGEERIVARIAILPFVAESQKQIVVREAVQAFLAPTGLEEYHWKELLSFWKQMSVSDVCHVLVRAAYDRDVLFALGDLAPLLSQLAGNDVLSRIAAQIADVGGWMRDKPFNANAECG